LYWPQAFDGNRLAMSSWIASCEMASRDSAPPTPAELLLNVLYPADLEQGNRRQRALNYRTLAPTPIEQAGQRYSADAGVS